MTGDKVNYFYKLRGFVEVVIPVLLELLKKKLTAQDKGINGYSSQSVFKYF
jgi:hypothetical protein